MDLKRFLMRKEAYLSMGRTKKYEIDMCNGPILKKMLIFALPLMLSSILQLLFNAADIVVVGRFAGDDSLAAVGSTSSLINLLTNLFIGLSVGANVLVARYFGAKKEEELIELEKHIDVDVLKIAHHGSKTSTSEYFLNNINFKIGIAMTGYNNTFGLSSNILYKKHFYTLIFL